MINWHRLHLEITYFTPLSSVQLTPFSFVVEKTFLPGRVGVLAKNIVSDSSYGHLKSFFCEYAYPLLMIFPPVKIIFQKKKLKKY